MASPGTSMSAQFARALYEAALKAVSPEVLLPPALVDVAWPTQGDLRVLCAGKASASLWNAFKATVKHPVKDAIVVTHSTEFRPTPGARRFTSTHPLPSPQSEAAALAVTEMALRNGPDDLLLVLLSGGASAMLSAPIPGLSLAHLTDAVRACLHSGMNIEEMNIVRRPLNRLAGGRLAALAGTGRVITLALSDVPGNHPATLASGPTVPSPTCASDALQVFHRYDVPAPDTVYTLLDTKECLLPRESEAFWPRCHFALLGDNAAAVRAVADAAQDAGYAVQVEQKPLTSEARKVGPEIARHLATLPHGTVWVRGGETTVEVRGTGIGGRCHEMVLAAMPHLAKAPHPLTFLAGGTDGKDGRAPSAGAWATRESLSQLHQHGFDVDALLHQNDSWTGLSTLGLSLPERATGTNVMDLFIGVVSFPTS